jgi:hypothetical protein
VVLPAALADGRMPRHGGAESEGRDRCAQRGSGTPTAARLHASATPTRRRVRRSAAAAAVRVRRMSVRAGAVAASKALAAALGGEFRARGLRLLSLPPTPLPCSPSLHLTPSSASSRASARRTAHCRLRSLHLHRASLDLLLISALSRPANCSHGHAHDGRVRPPAAQVQGERAAEAVRAARGPGR